MSFSRLSIPMEFWIRPETAFMVISFIPLALNLHHPYYLFCFANIIIIGDIMIDLVTLYYFHSLFNCFTTRARKLLVIFGEGEQI